MSDYTITSFRGQEMLTFLPRYYETSRVMRSLLQAGGTELDGLEATFQESLRQFFVATATWGLDIWEKELGLTVIPNLTDDERRMRIVSQIKGFGTCTISLVKQVAESYKYGDVEVIEDFPVYTVTIKFVDTRGIPSNLDNIKAALRAVVPAHLDLKYEFSYLTWDELDSLALNWVDLDDLLLTWDQLEVFRPTTPIVRASIGLTMSEQ